MRIYVTHCSATKDDSLKYSGEKVTPDRLYTASPTQRFMNKCKEKQVKWVILSDLYGIWFPHERHEWYDKHPDTVTDEEEEDLVRNFEEKLSSYDEIGFYYNPGRIHPLYLRILDKVKLKDKIFRFTYKDEIV